MNLAKELITMQGTAWRHLASKQHANIPIFEEWLLEHGEECGPSIKVKGQRLRKIKQCYQNTVQALLHGDVDDKEWFYTEGVVARPDLPIPINHAWLTNRKGEVLDLTLRNSADASYFGIPYKREALIKAIIKHGYYGLFSDSCTYNRSIVGKPVGRTSRAWKKKEHKS